MRMMDGTGVSCRTLRLGRSGKVFVAGLKEVLWGSLSLIALYVEILFSSVRSVLTKALGIVIGTRRELDELSRSLFSQLTRVFGAKRYNIGYSYQQNSLERDELRLIVNQNGSSLIDETNSDSQRTLGATSPHTESCGKNVAESKHRNVTDNRTLILDLLRRNPCWTYREVARKVGLSVSAVKMVILRAKRRGVEVRKRVPRENFQVESDKSPSAEGPCVSFVRHRFVGDQEKSLLNSNAHEMSEEAVERGALGTLIEQYSVPGCGVVKVWERKYGK